MQVLERLSYIGPNRRSAETVAEWQVEFCAADFDAIKISAADQFSNLRQHLAAFPWPELRELTDSPLFSQLSESTRDPGATGVVVCHLVGLITRLSVAIQQAAGHRVKQTGQVEGQAIEQIRFFYEFEHDDLALLAGELAMGLVCESIDGLDWYPEPAEPGAEDREADEPKLSGATSADAIDDFLTMAADLILPEDAQAIIDAARRADVPCAKLERDPYSGLDGEFRIRRHGLLRLGHACYQHVVDGTLCIDRNASLVPLLFDRNLLFQALSRLDLPVAWQDPHLRNLVTSKRAAKAAAKIGFPVVVKPVARSRVVAAGHAAVTGGSGVFGPLHDAEAVRNAFEQCGAGPKGVIVERFIAGRTVHLLTANHKWMGAICTDSRRRLPGPVHHSLQEMAENVAQRLDAGLLSLTVVTSDPAKPLNDVNGGVIDLDPAPRLDVLLASDSELLASACDKFISWLYPEGSPSRIPLVAVTGTNGKTTTSRMVSSIMQSDGYTVGMASTTGMYVDGILQQEGDLAGDSGHHHVFESQEVNFGVLETARGAIAHSGFMFEWCNVGVCLNVTADHIGQYGVDTVADMARIKRSVLERAREAVVINADYQTCVDMLPLEQSPRVYAASINYPVADVKRRVGDQAWVCNCEHIDNAEWVVLHGPDGSRYPVAEVNRIPACLDGAARFNVSNAQHAICAGHAMQVGMTEIRQALYRFEASFENNPGRLNVFEDLPFTVVMDYAHNDDGLEKAIHALEVLVEKKGISGRKILLYATTGDRSLSHLQAFSLIPKDFFDHFVCRSYPSSRSRLHPEYPTLMRDTLMASGIDERNVTVVDDAEDGTRIALDLARPGDLVMLCPASGELQVMWDEITGYSFQPD